MSLLADLIFERAKHLQGRSLGTEWGRVEDVEDPKGMGRIKVKLAWHKEGEMSHWIPRQTGGGSGYGENGGIPQPGELVQVSFDRGDAQQRMTYTTGAWTEGGMGTSGKIPPSLPPHRAGDSRLFAQPLHQPEKGKFKVWYDRSISGWVKWVGEGLDWLLWRSPKGFSLTVEHGVPVGGKTKEEQVAEDHHHLAVETPGGHRFSVTEQRSAGENVIELAHAAGMGQELRDEGGAGQAHRLTQGGKRIEMVSAPGAEHLTLDGGGGGTVRIVTTPEQAIVLAATALLRGTAVTMSWEAASRISLTAPLIVTHGMTQLGGPGGMPVARVGDLATGVTALGEPVTVTIVSGAALVTAV